MLAYQWGCTIKLASTQLYLNETNSPSRHAYIWRLQPSSHSYRWLALNDRCRWAVKHKTNIVKLSRETRRRKGSLGKWKDSDEILMNGSSFGFNDSHLNSRTPRKKKIYIVGLTFTVPYGLACSGILLVTGGITIVITEYQHIYCVTAISHLYICCLLYLSSNTTLWYFCTVFVLHIYVIKADIIGMNFACTCIFGKQLFCRSYVMNPSIPLCVFIFFKLK